MNQNEEALIGALEQRIAALEQAASGQKEPETERGRMQRERQERIDAKRDARPDNDERRMGDPRPTSRQRREEPKRTSTALPGPALAPPRQPTPQAPKLGDTIEIVVVDNGEFKTGNFYIDGGLTDVP